jgi:hypothetical protein
MLAELQNQGKVAASSVLNAWSKTISSVDDQRSCSVCLDEDERASEQSSTPQFPTLCLKYNTWAKKIFILLYYDVKK